jgi:pimeloyl-ACP methyl ester carboxylesterase
VSAGRIGRRPLGILLLLVLATDAVAAGSASRSAVYPGSNGKIAYVRNDVPRTDLGKPCGGDEIWIVDAGGSNAHAIPSPDEAYVMGDPTWSPDGTRLAYAYVTEADYRDRNDPDHLTLMMYSDAANRDLGPVATIPLLDHLAHDAEGFCDKPYGATWSRDSRKLVVQSYYGAHVINLARDNEVTVMDPPTTTDLRRFSWSPVESKLVFERGAPHRDIQTMPASGGQATGIRWEGAPSGYNEDCPPPGEGSWGRCDLVHLTRPEWSPDGSAIMVATGGEGSSVTGRIGFLDACDTGPLRVVDPNPRNVDVHWYEPAWSPDGTKVVFSDAGYVADPTVVGGSRRVQDLWVMDPTGGEVVPLTETPGDVFESSPDWQPVDPPETPANGCAETLPIVFLPGMLGSDMVCDPRELWPHFPDPRFDLMTLAWNGVDNGENGDNDNDKLCSSIVSASGYIVDEGYGYADTIKFLDGLPPSVEYHGYDWRKSPLLAVPGLDARVDELLARTGADKVVLMAHSMGGLVARAYVDAHPSKVDRVVTLGTPYLGAPKTWLALARGRTAPKWNFLDNVILRAHGRARLQLFSRTSTGAFYLYPSERYVSSVARWLAVPDVEGGALLDEQQVLEAVRIYHGNETLLQEAYDVHATLLEVYPEGDVDWQMIVGSGVETLRRIHEAGRKPRYVYGNGDGTVPNESAAMGDADPTAVHYVCKIEHGSLPGDSKVTRLIRGFLLHGDPIGGLPKPCSPR